MCAVKNLDVLLQKTAKSSADNMIARDETRERAVDVIRELETRLCEAIAGDVLRGLGNIAPYPDCPKLQGARVHTKPPHGIDYFIPRGGKEAMFITKDGFLAWGKATDKSWVSRPVEDNELRAEDLEYYVSAMTEVLQRHIARVEKTNESYFRVRSFAEKLAQAFDFDFE